MRDPKAHVEPKKCICCLSENLLFENTPTSLFLSRGAWGGSPEQTQLIYCKSCGFRTYERKLSESESKRYYSSYRGNSYVAERSRDELFYSQARYDQDEQWMASPHRQKEMLALLRKTGDDISQFSILDYGGDSGRFIFDLKCIRLAVYDLSEGRALSGVTKYSNIDDVPRSCWDLVVSTQTLEHISHPEVAIESMIDIAKQGGLIYIELPNQPWTSFAGRGKMRDALVKAAVKNRLLHKVMDLYSTFFRVKFNVLPPFGFAPMREHVNFFTIDSINKLGERHSLRIESSSINPSVGIQVLFRKLAAQDSSQLMN